MGDYTAKNIKVVVPSIDEQKFDWVTAEHLANKYQRPLEFIQRSMEACRRSGVSPQWFIDRYLEKVPGTPRNESVEFHSAAIQQEAVR